MKQCTLVKAARSLAGAAIAAVGLFGCYYVTESPKVTAGQESAPPRQQVSPPNLTSETTQNVASPQQTPATRKMDAPAPAAQITKEELRGVLVDVARAHEQKTQLAAWVSIPFARPVGPAFKAFYAKMGQRQGELLKELRDWAKGHGVDLTFHYSPDTEGQALKIMEARQEKLVRADNQTDFERDMLVQMFSDYEWQISLVEALLPRVTDPALKSYLQKSLKVHREGSAEVQELLKRFKFAG